MVEELNDDVLANVCAHEWDETVRSAGRSLADGHTTSARGALTPSRLAPATLRALGPRDPPFHRRSHLRTGLRRDELVTLAEIGRRRVRRRRGARLGYSAAGADRRRHVQEDAAEEDGTSSSPRSMTPIERVRADDEGTSSTIGRHPMALHEAARASRCSARDQSGGRDLGRPRAGRARHHAATARYGQRIRVSSRSRTRPASSTSSGAPIFHRRANDRDLGAVSRRRRHAADQDGVTSVKAERFQALSTNGPEPQSRDYR